MNQSSAGPFDGWRRSPSVAPSRTISWRHAIAPLAAILFLTLALLVYGASQPMSALILSVCFTATAVLAIALAGPRHVTSGMAAGIIVIWIFAASGLAGNASRAAPDLAVLFAAGAIWSVGYVCARSRGALDLAWSALIWSSLAFSVWTFFTQVASGVGAGSGSLVVGFRTPAEAAVVFGMLGLIAWSRLLHIVRKMDAEALAHSAMFDRLLREGLNAILLLAFSLTCLAAAGSTTGLILTAAAMVGLAWWETRPILQRQHRGATLKLLGLAAPFAALGLAAWGISMAWLRDESVAPGVGAADTLPHIQRALAYIDAWLESPMTGHGLGSAEAVGDSATTLSNAKAMLAPGGAQNVFLHWLVESGVIGLGALLLVLAAMHVRIFSGLHERGAARTLLRLAVATGFFLLLHGVSDSSLDLPGVAWLYALLLGMACGVAARPKNTSRSAIR